MFSIITSEHFFNKIKEEESKAPQKPALLHKLLNQQPVKVLAPSEAAKYKAHPEAVLDHPSSLYILDISPSEASAIQKRYGVLCLSSDCPDISPLIDVNDIHTPNEGETLARGWDSVLDSVEALPSNALLLTDRYLFASRNKDLGDGLANIHSILTELLPLDFSGDEYHVTVVFCKDKKHSSYKFSEIAAKLNNIAQQMGRHYPIMMEVFGISEDSEIYDNLHNRRIISNYYLVEATHKLAAFNRNLGTAQQLLIPLALFTESSLNGSSTSPLESMEQTIDYFHNFFDDILYQKDKDIDYLYALNGIIRSRCTEIRNRLMKHDN